MSNVALGFVSRYRGYAVWKSLVRQLERKLYSPGFKKSEHALWAYLRLTLLSISLAVAAGVGYSAEFAIPTASSYPTGITAGPDGNLWFTENLANQIGRITPAGVITEFVIPTPNSDPSGIAAGPDGNLWFTEFSGKKIGRITPTGVITEFAIQTAGLIGADSITAGPDGNLWFTESYANKIGRITPAGVISEFSVPTANSGPSGISAGPDGNLWFTEGNTNKIGRITPAGAFTEFLIPTAGSQPWGITAGPDGNLWFTENSANKIGRITPAGSITEFVIPTGNSGPASITVGPDGNLWFTEPSNNKIGRITPAGVITEFAIATTGGLPWTITAGPDGKLWFTVWGADKIANIQPPGATGASVTPTTPLPPPATTQTVFTVPTGKMPTAAVSVSPSGTFGNATLVVTLDLSKVLSDGVFSASGQFADGYNIYVAALVPAGVLGLPSATWFVYPSTRSWAELGSPIAAYKESIAENATDTVEISILQEMDVTGLVGSEIYIGYGTSDTEMLSESRYRGVYKVQ